MDKTKLVARAKVGDPAALAEVYARYQPAIYRHIFYTVGDVARAEDLTGDVFVHLVETIDRIPRQGDRLLAWLYSIARDRVSHLHQRAQRNLPIPSEEQATMDKTDSDRAARQRVPSQQIVAAVARLTDDQYQVILLKVIEGLNNETVAWTLGKPISAIQPLQQEALVALAQALAQYDVTQVSEPCQSQEGELEQSQCEFIQNVAHGLRTPLTLIQSYADLLLSDTLGQLEPKQRDALGVIRDRTGELSQVIRNLTSTQDIPKESLALSPLSVPEWVENTLNQYRHSADQAGIQFAVELSDDLPTILGDHNHLNVALSQVFDNAIKFSPEKGLVRVQAWTDGEWLYLAVQDQGIGIAPQHLDRVFDRFYQADSSTTRRFGGLGVGLTIVRAVAKAHGGRVWATSEGPGQGSTFTLALPVAPAESPPSRLEALAPPSPVEQGLSQALDEILLTLQEGQATVEECLAHYSEYATDLRPLVRTALEVRRVSRPTSSRSAYDAGKQRMLEALTEKMLRRPMTCTLLARCAERITAILGRHDRPAVPGRALVLQHALRPAIALFVLILAGLFWLAWLGKTIPQKATLVQSSGIVEVLSPEGETWHLSSAGDRIDQGDRIRTGLSSSATLVFFDGSIADLGAASEITIAQMDSRRDGSSKVIVLHQWLGHMHNLVDPLNDAASRFWVETPTAVAAVGGTEFTITTEADGSTHVLVIEGVVNVTSRETTIALLDGQETSVPPDPASYALCPPCATTPTPWPSPSLPHPVQEPRHWTQTPGPDEATGSTRTPTPSAAPRATRSQSLTRTPVPSPSPTARFTPPWWRPEPTPSPTDTPAATSTLTPTPSCSPTPTETPTPTPTETPTSTPTKTPTSTPTKTPTSTPTKTPTSTPTKTPTSTLTTTYTLKLVSPLQFKRPSTHIQSALTFRSPAQIYEKPPKSALATADNPCIPLAIHAGYARSSCPLTTRIWSGRWGAPVLCGARGHKKTTRRQSPGQVCKASQVGIGKAQCRDQA